MDRRRAYLRDLATAHGDRWAQLPSAPALLGDLRVETRNTIYEFRGGACSAITRRESRVRADPAAIIGMRILGFLSPDDPYAGLQLTWRPGAFAVLWRPREHGVAPAAQVALTSSTTAIATIHRPTLPPRAPSFPPPPRLPRISTPPPLPMRARGATGSDSHPR